MKKSNLGSELREHRERHGLTTKQMADKFNVPEQDYIRVESGSVTLSPVEEKRYWNLLAQEKLGPPKIRKWYQSKAWHLPIPIVICIAVISLLSLTDSAREGWGEKEGAEPPFDAFIIVSLVFCFCYWYFWTPELAFKKSGNQKNLK